MPLTTPLDSAGFSVRSAGQVHAVVLWPEEGSGSGHGGRAEVDARHPRSGGEAPHEGEGEGARSPTNEWRDQLCALTPSPTAPAVGVILLPPTDDSSSVSRLKAELDGRIAVGTQALVIDLAKVDIIGSALLVVLADAATRLRDERCGSVILRDAPTPILQQLRLMRLDHLFDLEL